MRRSTYLFMIVATGVGLGACGGATSHIPGTRVADTAENRGILEVVENYRTAVENKDSEGLILLASREYWEDAGTSSRKDDYGYEELKDVLAGRFRRSDDIRYSLRYMRIQKRCPTGNRSDDSNKGCRAYVDVLVDASYSIPDERGRDSRRDKRDQNQMVLTWDKGKWRFISGM